MIFTETKLPNAYIIDIEKMEDSRGFFARIWCQKEFEKYGLNVNLAQANTSFSLKKGTIRGFGFHKAPCTEAKIIRCVRGAIYDVMIDLRPDSSTFLKWNATELTAGNNKMVYIPEGFAHGFLTLTDHTEVVYFVTDFFKPGTERGIRWNDPLFKVEWPFDPLVIADKDKSYPDFTLERLY